MLHVNATAFGGGVAELLATLVPLMRDAGLDAHWQVIEGAPEFFHVTKAFHNGLQGMDVSLTQRDFDTFLHYNRLNAERLSTDWDFIILHDPQPAAMARLVQEREQRPAGAAAGKPRWIWRCHIDLSSPNPVVRDFLRPWLEAYDAGIFTLRRYAGTGLQLPIIAEIPPSIDPLSPKNAAMSEEEARGIVGRLGVDTGRPLITQVSRFDPWKDPLGVIDAFRLVQERVPGVQLAMVGSLAHDDPEGQLYYDKTKDHAGGDPDIHLYTNLDGVADREVNAFQRVSQVILQKSLREGFGLTVSEALWKGTPVVGGNAGGIPIQIDDGVCGYLVESVQEAAERATYLLQHPGEAAEMGRAGQEKVRRRFLSTRNLLDYLHLFQRLA